MTTTMPTRDTRTPFQRLADGAAAVPGIVLHTDSDRNLVYIWHDQSQDGIDRAPRESGIETSTVTVLDTNGTCVAYLRISYTSKEIAERTFGRLLEWAEENRGWCLGQRAARRGYGDDPTPQRLWVSAHTHAQKTPRSLARAGEYVAPWSLTEAMAPSDHKVLDADLKAIERTLRPEYKRWLDTMSVPFVAYSHTADEIRGTGVGRAMYLAAARHLATMGLVLRASDCQTDLAQGLWARLADDPTVPTVTVTMLKHWRGKDRQTRKHLAIDCR